MSTVIDMCYFPHKRHLESFQCSKYDGKPSEKNEFNVTRSGAVDRKSSKRSEQRTQVVIDSVTPKRLQQRTECSSGSVVKACT